LPVKISIFGLGYVGAVCAACLARDGHQVIGVDPNPVKVDMINRGNSPIIEQGVQVLIAAAVAEGRLSTTTSAASAVRDTELTLVCVGTPSESNGSLNLAFVVRACQEIGAALREKTTRHVVVIRSTVLPGTMHGTVIPTLEAASGKKAGLQFGVCNNPEFLREGSAVSDFDHPPKTVIGQTDEWSGGLLASLYEHIDAPMIRTDVATAEMVKYVDNVWHALKVGFANEIGNLCKALGLDSHAVMDIFCQDRKLNLSSYYLKPGFAFGGSCLPKDLRALLYRARSLDLELPILGAVLPSNEMQTSNAIKLVVNQPGRRVGVLGFTFKAGTDDLRESPVVELIERLIGKGYEMSLYDQNVNLARLIGANREYISEKIPHIARLLRNSIDEVLDSSDTIVIGNGDPAFAGVLSHLKPHQRLIDLVRIVDAHEGHAGYEGIAW
jgi:GDP-mannose 6-dehydrogenase